MTSHFIETVRRYQASGRAIRPSADQLSDLIRDLLSEGAETGDVRDDVAPSELVGYCLHAIAAAGSPRPLSGGS